MSENLPPKAAPPLQILSAKEIELRKRWLEFGSQDEELIQQVDDLVATHTGELIDDLYSHFLSFDETASFFPNQAILDRAKSAQKQYFARLTQGNYDKEYVADRLRIGSTHYRIDLDPKWYLGAYNHVVGWFSELLLKHLANDPTKLVKSLSALRKLVFFDMGLAIETYIQAKEAAIRKHKDTLQELETTKKVTKDILENAPIGIVRLSSELICLECNQKFLDLINAPNRANVVGRNLFDLAPKLPREVFQAALLTDQSYHQSGQSLHFANIDLNKDYWDWAVWPVKDDSGGTIGLIAQFANASDRMLIQQQREDFVATLTHDLKTPILAANRAVKLLMDGDFGPVSNEQTQILQTMHDSNSALYKLVQTLLDVYRYDSGAKELHMALVNLAATINQVVAGLRPLAQAQAIELITILPEESNDVLCDEEEIRRVIQNLLDNSLKFTPGGGSITVFMEQTDKQTVITVKDTGKGISPEDQPKLFQRFWQAASSGRYYASTGLGLYLCRKIIERHKGRIWCESKPGSGSTFSFTIEHQS